MKGDIEIKYLDFFSHKHYKDFESYFYKINRHVIKSFESGSQIHKNYLILTTNIIEDKLMKIYFYSTKKYDRDYFSKQNSNHELTFNDYQLNADTAIFAKGYDAVCIFVNDICDAEVLSILNSIGIKNIGSSPFLVTVEVR